MIAKKKDRKEKQPKQSCWRARCKHTLLVYFFLAESRIIKCLLNSYSSDILPIRDLCSETLPRSSYTIQFIELGTRLPEFMAKPTDTWRTTAKRDSRIAICRRSNWRNKKKEESVPALVASNDIKKSEKNWPPNWTHRAKWGLSLVLCVFYTDSCFTWEYLKRTFFFTDNHFWPSFQSSPFCWSRLMG